MSNSNLDRKLLKLESFMNVCSALSELSHDSKYKVATIIFTDNFREICSIGYNGDYKGGPNSRTDMLHGQSGFLHSEENALMHLAKPFELRNRLVLMCTYKPCSMCAKRIVNSGITRVVYQTFYEDTMNVADTVFSSANVSCKSYCDLRACPEELRAFLIGPTYSQSK